MRRIAYICHPHLGGAFTFFQQARRALLPMGLEFRCLSTVPQSTLAGTLFETMDGIDALPLSGDAKRDARSLIAHLVETGFETAVSLPCCGALGAALPRYMPKSIGNVLRVPMMSRGAYAPTHAVAAWVSRIVAVSDRVAGDLQTADPALTSVLSVVYNGVDVKEFPVRSRTLPEGPIRLLYAGRLSDVDKGVLLLPDVLLGLRRRGVSVVLQVAGEGPEAGRFREAVRRKGVGDMVRMAGPRGHGETRQLMCETDIFLLPSRLEGCPNALMEAMAAGCVCVAAAIKDSVTRIVEDGISGLLFPAGDAAGCADCIARLAASPSLWPAMGAEARRRIEGHFSLARMAHGYVQVFDHCKTTDIARQEPLDVRDFRVLRESKPTWRRFVPLPVKTRVRALLERRGRSI